VRIRRRRFEVRRKKDFLRVIRIRVAVSSQNLCDSSIVVVVCLAETFEQLIVQPTILLVLQRRRRVAPVVGGIFKTKDRGLRGRGCIVLQECLTGGIQSILGLFHKGCQRGRNIVIILFVLVFVVLFVHALALFLLLLLRRLDEGGIQSLLRLPDKGFQSFRHAVPFLLIGVLAVVVVLRENPFQL
jgi:hypothetical protein